MILELRRLAAQNYLKIRKLHRCGAHDEKAAKGQHFVSFRWVKAGALLIRLLYESLVITNYLRGAMAVTVWDNVERRGILTFKITYMKGEHDVSVDNGKIHRLIVNSATLERSIDRTLNSCKDKLKRCGSRNASMRARWRSRHAPR